MKNLLLVFLLILYYEGIAHHTMISESIDKTIIFDPYIHDDIIEHNHSTLLEPKAVNKTIYLNPSIPSTQANSDSIIPPVILFDDVSIAWQDIIENDSRFLNPEFEYNDLHFTFPGNSYLIDNKLISTYLIGLFWGTLVTCHDIQTGEEMWQKSYTQDTQDFMESYVSAYHLGGDIVELVGTRHLLTEEIPQFLGIYGKPVKRQIDINTGETTTLIASDISDPESGQVLLGNTSVEPTPMGRLDENSYLAFQEYGYLADENDATDVDSFSIGGIAFDANNNSIGLGIDSNNFFYKIPNKVNSVTLVSDIKNIDHQYVMAMFSRFNQPLSEPIDLSTFNSMLVFSDRLGNAQKVVDFTSEIGTATDGDLFINNNNQTMTVLASGLANATSDQGLDNTGRVQFDFEGNILDYQPQLVIDGITASSGTQMCVLDDGRAFYIFREKDALGRMYLYEFNNGIYTLIKMFENELLAFAPTKLQYDESFGIIINIRVRNVYPDGTFDRNFDYVIGVDNETLGLTTSTENLTDTSDTMKIYPNPSTDQFTVDFEEAFSGQLRIFSMDGKLMDQLDIQQQIQLSVQTQDWFSGTYTLQFLSKERAIFKKVTIQ